MIPHEPYHLVIEEDELQRPSRWKEYNFGPSLTFSLEKAIYFGPDKTPTDSSIQEARDVILACQREMKAFAEFLKKKFFAS